MTDLAQFDPLADSPDNKAAVPDSPALQNVSNLVTEWDKNKGEVKKLEAMLAERKARMRAIEENDLPASMTEAGITKFVTSTGREVVVDEVVRGNIPALTTIEKLKGGDRVIMEKRRNEAYDYVREHWPGLVKTELSVSLGKGETEVATRIAELIRNQFELDPSIDETIHPASLNSHFKELKNDGKLEEIPADLFSLYVGPIAKIK